MNSIKLPFDPFHSSVC